MARKEAKRDCCINTQKLGTGAKGPSSAELKKVVVDFEKIAM